jgi:hypothetical protein
MSDAGLRKVRKMQHTFKGATRFLMNLFFIQRNKPGMFEKEHSKCLSFTLKNSLYIYIFKISYRDTLGRRQEVVKHEIISVSGK